MAHTIEVEFKEDERALLNLLNARMKRKRDNARGAKKRDECLTVSDTDLIRDLKLEECADRYHSAKMRLVLGKVIDLHADGQGNQLIELRMPERHWPNSRRYVTKVIPWVLSKKVDRLIAEHFRETEAKELTKAPTTKAQPAFLPRFHKPAPIRQPLGKRPAEPTRQPTPTPATPPTDQRDYTRARELAHERLGVRPVRPGPLRPPIRKTT